MKSDNLWIPAMNSMIRIDIRIQKTAMDAKSLLGMLLMKTEEPLEIEYACYDDEEYIHRFSPATVCILTAAGENVNRIF